MLDLMDTLEKIKSLAVAVGRMQQENLGQNLQVHHKARIDLVTNMDKASEAEIINFLKAHYPQHAILAEESGLSPNTGDYLWIIDPLDGTTNYAQGLPVFAVSIALQYRGSTVLGVVYAPVLGQLFTAVKGQGAYLNGEKLTVSTKTDLTECVLATGFPYDIAETPVNNLQYFSHLMLKTRAVRRMGAAAYDIACVAAGKFDGYWEMNLQPWDTAAAMLMVEEAGGEILHFRDDRKVSIIAGNQAVCRRIHAEIQAVDRQGAVREC